MVNRTKLLDPIHPGEILNEEFMRPLGISINRLSRELHVPPNRIHGIVHGSRAITADTALRLGTYFGVSPETWLNLQSEYESAPRPQDRRRGDCQDSPEARSRLTIGVLAFRILKSALWRGRR